MALQVLQSGRQRQFVVVVILIGGGALAIRMDSQAAYPNALVRAICRQLDPSAPAPMAAPPLQRVGQGYPFLSILPALSEVSLPRHGQVRIEAPDRDEDDGEHEEGQESHPYPGWNASR